MKNLIKGISKRDVLERLRNAAINFYHGLVRVTRYVISLFLGLARRLTIVVKSWVMSAGAFLHTRRGRLVLMLFAGVIAFGLVLAAVSYNRRKQERIEWLEQQTIRRQQVIDEQERQRLELEREVEAKAKAEQEKSKQVDDLKKTVEDKDKEIDKLNKDLQAKAERKEQERLAAARQAANVSLISTRVEPSPAPAPAPVASYGGDKQSWLAASGIPANQWGSVDFIVSRESGWNPNAVNPSSGACGLGQQLPCGKWAGAWNDPVAALRAQYAYVNQRYGGYNQAVTFWQNNHWY